MPTHHSETAQQVAALLGTARRSLGLDLTFLSRIDGVDYHLEAYESGRPVALSEGVTVPREVTFCHAIMKGILPAVMPDVRAFPAALELPWAAMGVASFISVPVILSDGTVYGTLCAAGFEVDDDLGQRDRALMEVLAQAAAVVLEPDVRNRRRNVEIEGRLRPVIDDGGPLVLLQPIVDLSTGRRVGAEALSRFPAEWRKAPDVVFGEAALIGDRERLELQALRRAAAYLPQVRGYVAMNISPATLWADGCVDFLSRLPLDRIVLELSEHDPIDDYDALGSVLAPLRSRGMGLAVDDAGAGFSSLRHIVATAPDIVKLDRSIVAGVAEDRVLAAVVRSVAQLAEVIGATVVAEGVETAAEAARLAELAVPLGQGWHFDRATAPHALRDSYILTPAAALASRR